MEHLKRDNLTLLKANDSAREAIKKERLATVKFKLDSQKGDNSWVKVEQTIIEKQQKFDRVNEEHLGNEAIIKKIEQTNSELSNDFRVISEELKDKQAERDSVVAERNALK